MLERKPNDKLAQWILFLDNPNDREVLRAMKENEEIKEAMEDLGEISKIKQLRRIAELKEKAIRDEQNALAHATKDGKRMKQIEIAKKLLERKMLIEDIQEITLLSKEEIEKLK